MLLFPVILSYCLTCIYAQEDGLSSRILYGQVADITDFPYFAALEHCSAAIISDTWLLTAAHCVAYIEDYRYLRDHYYQSEHYEYISVENYQLGSVWVGGNNIENSQEYGYNAIVFHPDYDSKSAYEYEEVQRVNDIALLKLTNPLVFSESVQAVQLPQGDDENEMNDDVLTVAGIERNEYVTQYNNHLMKMDVSVLDLHQCLSHFTLAERVQMYLHRRELQNKICTKRVTRYVHDLPGLCHGDSGSPLVYNNILVGLGISSDDECRKPSISMFTKVAKYTEWIRYITGISINNNTSYTHTTGQEPDEHLYDEKSEEYEEDYEEPAEK